MHTRGLIATAAIAAIGLLAGTASAGTSFRVVGRYNYGCGYSQFVVDAHGADHTFARCGGRSLSIEYIDNVRGNVRRIKTSYIGIPAAVAQDDSGTSLLFLDRSSTHTDDDNYYDLYLGKRRTDGTFTQAKLIGQSDREQAQLATSDGHWWAIWHTSSGYRQALTFGGHTGSVAFGPPAPENASFPQIALNTSGAGLAGLWVLKNGQIRFAHAPASTGKWTSVPAGSSDQFDAAGYPTYTQLAVDGRRSYIARVFNGKTIVESNGEDGRSPFAPIDIPSEAAANTQVLLAVEDGSLWLLWDHVIPAYSYGTNCEHNHDVVARLFSLKHHTTWDMSKYKKATTRAEYNAQGQSRKYALRTHGVRARPMFSDDQGLASAEVG